MPTKEPPASYEESAQHLPFAKRLETAIRVLGLTQSSAERKCQYKPGRMHRLLGKGKSPILSPGIDVARWIADKLGIEPAWLAFGIPPMLKRPNASPSDLEEAITFARTHGGREDAIRNVVERFAGQTLGALDWIVEFDAESRRLEREGVPRPENVVAQKKRIARLSKKRALLKELAELEAEEQAAKRPPPHGSDVAGKHR